MNVRHFVNDIEEKEAQEIYFDFYVKRGYRRENRIKEVKNMCFSDSLSNPSPKFRNLDQNQHSPFWN